VNAAPALLFYGDDFTGATDALATAARCGLRSLLLLAPPNDSQLAAIGELDCLGIAGAARSMGPAEMADELAPVAALARRLQPRVLHYKTCSTFDSAPEVGSIGAAVRALQPVTDGRAAIVGGQPELGRYCLFGHLFAAAGGGGEVHRIDRHPTMSRHPVTPMHEADLRLHLAAQGLPGIGLVPYPLYAANGAGLSARLYALHGAGTRILLWDVAEARHLRPIGRQLWAQAQAGMLLAVGPSSVIEAIASAMPGHEASRPDTAAQPVAPARGAVLVLAGSLSPITARQVASATSFDTLRLDAVRLAEPDGGYRIGAGRDIASRLAAGRHMLVCTAPADGERAALPSRTLAIASGRLLAEVLALTPLARVGIAGGDTSSHGVLALDAWALAYAGQLAAGVPLCTLRSARAELDGLQLMLKGGQMGDDDIFQRLIQGTD
jgi:uncharacterized protein YgbK (DUF1537 family)